MGLRPGKSSGAETSRTYAPWPSTPISTCRFAQRVALVKNDARLNEETDPKLMIKRLKAEVERAREELEEFRAAPKCRRRTRQCNCFH